jgi:DNA-binding HxlR family transcriptional regulator
MPIPKSPIGCPMDSLLRLPPQVTYTLAARGRELADVIDRLDALAKKWMAEDVAVQQRATPSATSAVSSTAAE